MNKLIQIPWSLEKFPLHLPIFTFCFTLTQMLVLWIMTPVCVHFYNFPWPNQEQLNIHFVFYFHGSDSCLLTAVLKPPCFDPHCFLSVNQTISVQNRQNIFLVGFFCFIFSFMECGISKTSLFSNLDCKIQFRNETKPAGYVFIRSWNWRGHQGPLMY